MRFKLSFAVSNVFIRLVTIFHPQNNFLYSIDLFFTIFIMVNKLFSENHMETTRPHMKTFDTAEENLDPILSLK